MSITETYRRLVKKGNKKALLDFLANTFSYSSPSGTLEVAVLDRGRQRASKWRTWFEIRDNEWWVLHVNQRLIALAEVVFDFDPSEDNLTVIDGLVGDWETLGTYKTGSRGVHTHMINRDLMMMPREAREDWKRAAMRMAGADIMKAADRTMIALELAPHWKTGVRKSPL